MTTIYFVRHAQPNYENHNDSERELTDKGLEDSKKVTKYLIDKNIEVAISSPYKRTIDTIKDLCITLNLVIEEIYDLRERKISDAWIDDFDNYAKMQWDDFSYKLDTGESLDEVQRRNITAVESILDRFKDKNIVVGTHGTSLGTIVNYYDNNFNHNEFEKIKKLTPFILKCTFDNKNLVNKEFINFF